MYNYPLYFTFQMILSIFTFVISDWYIDKHLIILMYKTATSDK